MRILALDISSHTGYAVFDDGKLVDSGTWHLDAEDYAEKADQLSENFCGIIFKDQNPEIHIDAVIFEQPMQYKFGSSYLTTGLQFYLHHIAWIWDIPRYEISPTKMKKHITGKGNSTKQEVMNAIRELGYKPQSFDEADSIGIGLTYLDNIVA